MKVGVLGSGGAARVLTGSLGDLPYAWRPSGVRAASGKQDSSACRVPAVQTLKAASPDNDHRS